MIKKIAGLLLLLILFFACKEEKEEEFANADRTVLVYIMGENSLYNFIEKDIQEMERAVPILGKNTRLIVYIDDIETPRILSLKNESGHVVREVVNRYKEHCSTDPKIMSEVFSWVFRHYPASSYGLVLWSHGEGWKYSPNARKKSIGIDNEMNNNQNTGRQMNISELASVLKMFPKFEFIFFDACFMQAIEVAYELRNYTKYLIGSPTETPGPGAPYHVMIDLMFKDPLNIEDMITKYYNYYEGYKGYDWPYGSAISAIKCDELETLAYETAKILPNHIDELSNLNSAQIQIYDTRSPCLYYDLNGFIKSFANLNEYMIWKSQLDRCIPETYRKSSSKCFSAFVNREFVIDKLQYSGISTYIPQLSYSEWNSYYRNFEWFTASGWDKITTFFPIKE